VTSRVHQWSGNLFFRGVAPSEITSMEYHDLKYWNEWHELIAQANKDAGDG
jgi:hypothetical protein